jgi:AcrR family transcriptional regulator
VDRAILDTTLRLLVEQGYDAMSLEGVASVAGVGKTAIYRRYPGKRELVVAAVSSLAATLPPPIDSGDSLRDLRAFVRQALDLMRRDGLAFRVMGTLLVKERSEPELMELFRRTILLPRLQVGADIVRRGMDRGEIRPDVTADVVIQLIGGSFFARHVVGQPDDDAWLDTVLDALWRGVSSGG